VTPDTVTAHGALRGWSGTHGESRPFYSPQVALDAEDEAARRAPLRHVGARGKATSSRASRTSSSASAATSRRGSARSKHPSQDSFSRSGGSALAAVSPPRARDQRSGRMRRRRRPLTRGHVLQSSAWAQIRERRAGARVPPHWRAASCRARVVAGATRRPVARVHPRATDRPTSRNSRALALSRSSRASVGDLRKARSRAYPAVARRPLGRPLRRARDIQPISQRSSSISPGGRV